MVSNYDSDNSDGSAGSFIFSRAINSRLYATALAMAYRNGVEVYDPDYALAQDPEYWEKVQRDATIKHAIEGRLHSVAGREWSMACLIVASRWRRTRPPHPSSRISST